MYLYLTSYPEIERELARAECRALCGVDPDDKGLAVADKYLDLFRAAYVKTCAQVLASTTEVDELVDMVEALKIESDCFRVSVKKFVKLDWGTHDIMNQIGARIGGKVDLKNPKDTFLVVFTEERAFLSRVVSSSDSGWRRHIDKPYNTSSSLPARMAQAMINLVAKPGQSLVDPCCGTGTIIIEAVCANLKPTGYDLNSKMVNGTLENLRYFGLKADVSLGDARSISGNFDALATDLPYGINTKIDDKEYYQILENLANLSPKCAVVAANDIRKQLEKCGYQLQGFVRVAASSFFSRYIHVLSTPQSLTPPSKYGMYFA